MELEQGYYWVRKKEWKIAFWDKQDQLFYITSSYCFGENDGFEINENRILNPDEL